MFVVRSSRRLFLVDPGHLRKVLRPGLGRSGPVLIPRDEPVPLPGRSDPDAEIALLSLRGSRVQRASALGAKSLQASRTVVCRLGIQFRRSAQQFERARVDRNDGPVGRAGQTLAVGAMTDLHLAGIGFGTVSDLPAMASSVNLQRQPPRCRLFEQAQTRFKGPGLAMYAAGSTWPRKQVSSSPTWYADGPAG